MRLPSDVYIECIPVFVNHNNFFTLKIFIDIKKRDTIGLLGLLP